MIKSMVLACDSEMENVEQIQTSFDKNLLLEKLHKFITMNDTDWLR